MNRSDFLKSSLLGTGALLTGNLFTTFQPPLNKRERMLQWLEGKTQPGYTPAAFFLHFEEPYKLGSPAAQQHLKYFKHTDMDFVKIQFEKEYKPVDFIKKPSDWSKLQPNKLDFYESQLVAVRELVKKMKPEALVIMTIYSPFMWAGDTVTHPVLLKHMEEDPIAVKKGLDTLVESQMLFVKECIKIGVDGFYMSTQGSETKQFSNPKLFTDYIKPTDLVAMKTAAASCPFNILHVCDYNAPYANYNAVLDYPGQVVNCNPQTTTKHYTWQEIETMFKRPTMGGMERLGVISKGSTAEIKTEVRNVLNAAPKRFILGADCTVAGNTDWDKLKVAIETAHGI